MLSSCYSPATLPSMQPGMSGGMGISNLPAYCPGYLQHCMPIPSNRMPSIETGGLNPLMLQKCLAMIGKCYPGLGVLIKLTIFNSKLAFIFRFFW